ncbi:MAG: hypothetical protein AAB681_01435, partial [Patescibacteria group bacterium]
TPPPPQGGGGGHIPFLYDVVITPGVDKAVINYKTLSPTFATVTWGETIELKSGTTRSIIFVTNHSSVLTELNPGTQYFFLITVEGRGASVTETYGGTFVTTSFPQKHIVPNPSNVHANIGQKGITLKWVNPIDPGFDYIRIMRNRDRFRSSPFTGTLVYEGSTEYFLDTNVTIGGVYYYTLFTRETSGAFSSGVGVKTLFDLRENLPIVLPPPPIKGEDFLPHFLVIQKGQIVSPVGNVREVTGTDTISAQSMPGTFEGFGDLWVEITTPGKTETRAYLFNYDNQNKTYQTSIPPLLLSGDYPVRIYGFNQDHTALLSEGILRVPVSDSKPLTAVGVSNRDILVTCFWLILILGLILWLRRVIKASE